MGIAWKFIFRWARQTTSSETSSSKSSESGVPAAARVFWIGIMGGCQGGFWCVGLSPPDVKQDYLRKFDIIVSEANIIC